ncbi:hypothetical protein D3C78_1885670 [compost metagenome]
MFQRPFHALLGGKRFQLAINYRQCQRLPRLGQRIQRRQIEFSHVASLLMLESYRADRPPVKAGPNGVSPRNPVPDRPPA